MKKILIPLIHSMIAFTIIHAPIVLQYPVSYGVAFAQEVDSTTQEVVDSTSGSDPSIDDIPDSGETTGHQRWTGVPIGGIRMCYDVITFEPRYWDCSKFRNTNTVCKFCILLNNGIKRGMIIIN